MGQLAQDKAERPTRTFGANTKKNPKEECKAVLTRGQKKAQEEGKVEEEDRPEEERTETPEGRIEEEEKVASPPTTKSQKAREARKEEPQALPQDLPYPVVPTKKNKERYFKRFLKIFKGLEITMPFGEALQQMPLYSKFMKDILTKKGKYIDNENIVVGGDATFSSSSILPSGVSILSSSGRSSSSTLPSSYAFFCPRVSTALHSSFGFLSVLAPKVLVGRSALSCANWPI